MLTVGIALMALSVVLGVAAMAVAALMSSTARSVGSRVRRPMALQGRGQGAPYQPGPDRAEAAYPQQAEGAAAYLPPEEGAARSVVLLATLSGGGLVLGLVIVMIGSMV